MGVAGVLARRHLSPPNTIDLAWLASQFPDLSNLTPLSIGGQKLVLSADHPVDGAVVLKLIRPNQDIQTTERELLAIVQSAEVEIDRLAMVGHNPGFERLASRLIGQMVEMPTGSLIQIEIPVDRWADVDDGIGRVGRFVRPKELR